MQSRSTIQMRLLLFICFFSILGSSAQVKPETMQQIQLLLQEKKSRTPAQQKIDSRLLQAVKENRGEIMAKGVPLRRANVNADSSGRLKVDISGDVTEALLEKIKSLGGEIIYPSFKYHTVRVLVNLSAVENIASFPEVKSIKPAAIAITVDTNFNEFPANIDNRSTSTCQLPVNSNNDLHQFLNHASQVRKKLAAYLQCQNLSAGAITSEGDRTHRADDVRNTYGFEGQGVRIGVISDSYNALNGASQDVANGDLPGPGNPFGYRTAVKVIQDNSNGSDEGRAMLQVVHDLAPAAQLFFATGDASEAGFANNIEKLRGAPYNCDIIIDDVYYFDEAAFQDDIVAQAVNDVTASGALYFSSAGNSGSLQKGTSGVFEGDFNDKGSLLFAGDSGKVGSIHNFGTMISPVNGDIITFSGSEFYTLKWSDPAGASNNDYDLFLINSAGTIKDFSTTTQNGTQDPFEFIDEPSISNGDRLVVFKDSTAAVRAFHLNTNGGALRIGTNGQTSGHSSAQNAFAVAATPAFISSGGSTPNGPFPNSFVSTNKVEIFSSDGPRRKFFNADGTAITPGNFLFQTNGGIVINKPDITAADGVSTTLPASTFLNMFYGTSCAAPHAGAIAALLKSADSTLTAAQIRTILTSTALDIESAGNDNLSGAGIVQAFQAVQSLNPVIANVDLDSIFATEGSVANHNGFLEPGESANLNIRLKDPSTADATGISATLTTNTPGITITQGSSGYNNIVASNGKNINIDPFTFTIDNSVPCGTSINLILSVSYSGGKESPKLFPFTVQVGSQPGININSVLGSPVTSAGYTTGTGNQTGRLTRGSDISACESQQVNPGKNTAAGNEARKYDSYMFTNTTSISQCVTTTLTTAPVGDSIFCAAYNDSGYVLSSPAQHFLGDPGFSSPSESFSFNVPAGKTFTVVVHEVYPSTLTGFPYNLSVSLSVCNNSILPVSWLNFTATPQKNNEVLLQWNIANETNVSTYTIESATDVNQFNPLKNVLPTSFFAITKSYQDYDLFPAPGNNYYRIKEVDKDGHFTYSKIVMVSIPESHTVIITPNPASSFIDIRSETIMKHLELFSVEGKKLISVTPLANIYHLQLSRFTAGQYFLHIETDNEIINQKIIKQF